MVDIRDNSHLPDEWHRMARETATLAKHESQHGVWRISGERADLIGSRAMQFVADITELTVVVEGPTEYHAGAVFEPEEPNALAIEARRAIDRAAGVVGDESAARSATPKGERQ